MLDIEEPIAPHDIIFAFKMSEEPRSFFVEIKKSEMAFGLSAHDFNGKPILRKTSSRNKVNTLEKALYEEVVSVLNVPKKDNIKVMREDSNENVTDMYFGSWEGLKKKNFEDLGC